MAADNTLVLSGDILDFWSERSGFINMLRYTGNEDRDPLIINLDHIENPDLLKDLITLNAFQKTGGVFVYDKATGKPYLNPNRPYNIDDVYTFLDYMVIENPRRFLGELASRQTDRPRHFKYMMYNNSRNKFGKFNNSNYTRANKHNNNHNSLRNNNNNNNNNNNSNIVLGFINDNAMRASSRISNRNRAKINKITRRGKKYNSN
jgi:hypothetical protein